MTEKNIYIDAGNECDSELDAGCQMVSEWIKLTNQQEAEQGRPETMKPRTPEKIKSYIQDGRGVFIMESGDESERHPVGFCALTYVLEEGLDGIVYELGTLIVSPTSRGKGVGLKAVVATLRLPKAIAASRIVAYANRGSLPLFLEKLKSEWGVGAAVVFEEELKQRFPYLQEYSGDTIVDLTPVRNKLAEKNKLR